MGLARYTIMDQGDWHVEHDGKVAHLRDEGAAFEAAGASAIGTATSG
jgi:hypothetical protein